LVEWGCGFKYCNLPDCPWHEPRAGCIMRQGRPQKLLVGSGCEDFAGPIVNEERDDMRWAPDKRKATEKPEEKETIISMNNTVTESKTTKGNKSKESEDKNMVEEASAQTRTETQVKTGERKRTKKQHGSESKSDEFRIEMDLVKSISSLEFVSERGINSTDQGPYVLANQFGKQMMKQIDRRNKVIVEKERLRKKKAKEVKEAREAKEKKETTLVLEGTKVWEATCQTHEAYQFLRKKYQDKYNGVLPSPQY